MNDSLPIPIDDAALQGFCQRWKIVELSLFGSIERDDFGPDSDVDALVTFDPEARPSMFDCVDAKRELETIFGRSVDLLTRGSVEAHHNPWTRHAILSSAQPLYTAA